MKAITFKITFYATKADFKKKKMTESLEGYETKKIALDYAKIFSESNEYDVIVVTSSDKSFTKILTN